MASVPVFGSSPAPGRKTTDVDWTKYGNDAGRMREAYMAGTFMPPDFDGVPAPQPAQGTPGQTTTQAQNSPLLDEQINRYRDRFNVDNTKRAIDKSNLGIADSAALAAKDLGANMSRRGVLGTETGGRFLQKNVFEPAQRAAASAAANITMQREKDLDALVLGGTGLMTAPDQINLQNRQFSLQQMEGDRADQRFRAQMEQEERRRREEAARWMATMSNVGDYF